MAWTWRFETAGGTEVEPAVQPEEFPTQGDAESWVGEFWKELAAGGTDQVTLFDGDTLIYGPMSLHDDTAAAPDPTPSDESSDPSDPSDPSEPTEPTEPTDEP